MDIDIQENEENVRITFSGKATADASEEIRDALSEALQKSHSVILDVAGIKKADVSFLQLLISAEKTAQVSDKTIRLDPSAYSEGLINAAVHGGFCREEEYQSSESMHSILADYYTNAVQEASNG